VTQALRITFNREIVYVVAPREPLYTMLGNAEEIRQLFIIILDNALKYSELDIRIELSETTKAYHFDFIDHGIGIPEDEIHHVFERLYRVDKARSRKTGGVGLGLAIAQHIVQLHQGTILITSKLDEGTKVTVSLPK
jgi:two-component system sensor histidine kinase ArlS